MSRVAGAIVGRRAELDAVERFLAETPEQAQSLAIIGMPGVGKTTLWRAGVEHAAANGWRVLSARPAGVEASLSFAALGDLFECVAGDALAELPAPQRRALDVALLRASGTTPVEARAVATATQNLLRTLAADNRTLVAIDDAQWLDDASEAALTFALRRLVDAPVGVLTSVRVDGPRLETFELELPQERRREMELGPLSTAAVHDVIAGRLGESLARPTIVRIVEACGGNIYYALEIARELLRRESISDTVPVPLTLRGLVQARIERLPAATRDALLRASALAAPTTALLSEDALETAEDEDLVRIDADGRVRFAHPLLAGAVYESAPVARRRRVHRELAAIVEDEEEQARHLALATRAPDGKVASVLDDAAGHAASRGAAAAAAELARLALALTDERERETRVRRALVLAHHLLATGDAAGARAVLEACEPGWVEGDLRAELLRELGFTHWYEGEPQSGLRLAQAALAHARDPNVAAWTHGVAAWLAQDFDLTTAIEHEAAAVELLDPRTSPGRYSWSLLHLAYLQLLDGRGPDEDAYRRGVELQEGASWDDVSPVLGIWPLFHDDFVLARSVYESGLARSSAEGDETSVQGTLVRLAEIACWIGQWPEADRLATHGIELAERIGSQAYLGSALYARALVDAHLGRLESARTAAVQIVETFGGERPQHQEALGHWILGFVALSLGDAAAADAAYTRAASFVARLGQREPARFRFQPDHLEAVVEMGDTSRARVMLSSLEERLAVFPRPWLLATAARCRALVLGAEGDLRGAQVAAEEALEHHERLEMPFERARTLLVLGVTLRRLKQKRRARESLEEAESRFGSLGAPLWQKRAEGELARVAVRRSADGLTATELRIAQLAADGLTNPEIAARVFVSRKTIEANLARTYRKLGISSRAQLSRALDAIS